MLGITPKTHSAWLAGTCLISFVFLVVTTCSTPVFRNMNLFTLWTSEGSDTGGELKAGVLGFCFQPGVNLNTGSYTINVAETSSIFGVRWLCTMQMLGYEIVHNKQPYDTETRQWANVQSLTSENLTSAMVMSPLGAAVAGIGLVVSSIASFRRSAQMDRMGALLVVLTAIFSWVAFAVHMTISNNAKSEAENAQNLVREGETVEFQYGIATYLPLVPALVTTIVMLCWVLTRSWRPYPVEDMEQRDESSSSVGTDDVEMKPRT